MKETDQEKLMRVLEPCGAKKNEDGSITYSTHIFQFNDAGGLINVIDCECIEETCWPDDVFSYDKLAEWAYENGFVIQIYKDDYDGMEDDK